MKRFAYYNEIDPFAAQWIRELIKSGIVTDGEVDERSIEDVLPADVVGFARCHWFAGVAVWDYALNQAGYDRWDTVTWTGSCPCQPFSAAGKGGGLADQRNLWPAFKWLIRVCCPDIIFGEQVEAAIKHDWLDHVGLSLEAIGYSVGSIGFPACSVGAPHIRQRLYWVAYSSFISGQRHPGGFLAEEAQRSRKGQHYGDLPIGHSNGCPTRLLADAEMPEYQGNQRQGRQTQQFGRIGNAGELGDSMRPGSEDRKRSTKPLYEQTGPTNGFWSDAEWIPCRDGKARPTEPGTFPLADGTPNRVGRLRGYGNAIVAPQATEFIKAYLNIRRTGA